MEEKISRLLDENGFKPQDDVCITLYPRGGNTVFVEAERLTSSGFLYAFPYGEDPSREITVPEDVAEYVKSNGLMTITKIN